MTLNPHAIALQGIGYPPRWVALQGFVIGDIGVPPRYRSRRHRKGARLQYFEKDAEYTLTQLHQEDEAVTDLLIALVTKGFFDG